MGFALGRFSLRGAAVALCLFLGTLPATSGPPNFNDLANRRDEELGAAVASLFFAAMQSDEQLDALESAASKFRSKNAKTANGESKLGLLYDSIVVDPQDPRLDLFLDRWFARWPQSPTPYIIKSHVLLLDAVGARSLRSLHFDQAQSVQLPADKLRSLQKYLETHKKLARIDPHWFVLAAHTARLAQTGEMAFTALITEGLSQHPTYTAIYDAGTDYFMPGRTGDPSSLEKWASQLSSQTGLVDAQGAYARVYWHAFLFGERGKIFQRAVIDWRKFKLSSASLLQADPSPQNFARMTLMSCIAGDRQETKRLFAVSSEPLSFYPWSGNEERDICLKWARQSQWDFILGGALHWLQHHFLQGLKYLADLFRT